MEPISWSYVSGTATRLPVESKSAPMAMHRNRRREGLRLVFTHNGVSVSSWVILDGSCRIKPDFYGEHIELEIGTGGEFGLVLAESMVDELAGVLADAKEHFRKLDEQDAGGVVAEVAAGLGSKQAAA